MTRRVPLVDETQLTAPTDGARDSYGEAFERLVGIMARLRGPDGCPWDRAQSLESLRPYLIEEAYEVLDAIEAGEVASLDEDAEAPDGALHDLYIAADRLARDVTHAPARNTVFALVPQLSPVVPPFGLAVGAWRVIVERAHVLLAHFEAAADPELVTAAADELRTACRPYV